MADDTGPKTAYELAMERLRRQDGEAGIERQVVTGAQRAAIDNLGYGTNAKLIVGFDGRPWAGFGSNGTAYSDLTNHQLSWETNRVRASATRGVLTDYASGDRGASLDLTGLPATVADIDAFEKDETLISH